MGTVEAGTGGMAVVRKIEGLPNSGPPNNDPTQPEKLGFLTGYLADECVAGEAPTAWNFVDQQWQLGHVSDLNDPTAMTATEAAVRQFVVVHGYCPASLGITASRASSPTK